MLNTVPYPSFDAGNLPCTSCGFTIYVQEKMRRIGFNIANSFPTDSF